MLQNDLRPKEEIENPDNRHTQSGTQVLGLRREPSFSRWCNEDGVDHLNPREDTSVAAIEESDFALPILQRHDLHNGFLEKDRYQYRKFQMETRRLNGSDGTDHLSKPDERNTSDEYEPFSIENVSPENGGLLETSSDGSSSIDKIPSQDLDAFSVANVLKTLFFIMVWYTFSTFLTLYNKTLLGDDMGRFPAPLLMNTVHFTMQAGLSQAIVWYRSRRDQANVSMSWRDYFSRVVPTALATAMDVNLSNASLVFISVTFATMCKFAAPIFLLLFAFAFRLETPSIKLMGIISIISVGILLTVTKETAFEFWGLLFVMLAAVMSGFRWCMTQILLQKEDFDYMIIRKVTYAKIIVSGLKDPITFMSYVTPMMAMATGVLSLLFDPWHEFKRNNYFDNPWHVTRSCLLMLFGGTLAFFMVLTEYILVSVTSAVTVTIAGVVKEAVTILVAVFYFHDEFTWVKGLGLLTIMVGVSLFNWYKYLKLQEGHTGKDDKPASPAVKAGAKYVILEEMEEQDENL